LFKKEFLKRFRGHSIWGIFVIFSLIIYLNTLFPYYRYVPFWIIVVLNLLFVLIYLRLRIRSELLGIIFTVVCVLVPEFLSLAVSSLVSIKISILIYLLFLFLFTLYKPLWRFLDGTDKKNKKNINVISDIKIPGYLPGSYLEEERKTSKRKGYTTYELYYEKGVGENISIIQSDGPIPNDTQIDKKTVYNEKLKGINVTIESEEVSSRSKPEFHDKNISFKKAEWNSDGWYFILTAEELSLEETKKVIASMINSY
jgi:hypothetical protein